MKRKQPDLTVRTKLLYFCGGTALTVLAVLRFIYFRPMGFLGVRGTLEILTMGIVLMLGSVWLLLRHRTRD
jgi:hypothetical protein